ncbi:hypothetical protein JG688_00017915, partial [Phytophthora aleatoria]
MVYPRAEARDETTTTAVSLHRSSVSTLKRSSRIFGVDLIQISCCLQTAVIAIAVSLRDPLPSVGRRRRRCFARSDNIEESLIPKTPASLPSPVSQLGVPHSVKHSRKPGATDDVWNLIHSLELPYQKRNPCSKLNRNICVLCCEDIQDRTKQNEL